MESSNCNFLRLVKVGVLNLNRQRETLPAIVDQYKGSILVIYRTYIDAGRVVARGWA